MSASYPASMNPAQLNPALLQAMAAAHAQSQSNPNNNAFNSFHQTFQRLQSQESQKLDQQRTGFTGQAGGVNQQGQQIQLNQPQFNQQSQQQQQFMQMMQQAGMMNGAHLQQNQGMPQQQQQQLPQSQQQQQQQQPQMPQGWQNMGNDGSQYSMPMAGPSNPMNIHSQQQGLNLSGMPDSEQGRRQALQNMLSQQMQNAPAQQQQQQQQPQMQASRPNVTDQLKDFVKRNPETVQEVQRRHGGNQQAVMHELLSMMMSQASANAGMPGPSINNGYQQVQQQGQNQNFANQPNMLGLNQPQLQQQQHQQNMSAEMYQNLQNTAQMGAVDPKQMEALQAMKAAQQRGGMQNGPPSSEPQFNQFSPRPPNNMAADAYALQQLQQQQPQQQQQSQPQSNTMPTPQLPQAGSSKATDVQTMISGWEDAQLLKSTHAVVAKIMNQAQQQINPNDPTKFHLLQIIAEWKRRNKAPPPEAIQAAGQALNNQPLIAQLTNVDWVTLANFARSRAEAVTTSNLELSQSLSQPSAAGTQAHPIEISTPAINATPNMQSQSNMSNPAFQTPQQAMSNPQLPQTDGSEQKTPQVSNQTSEPSPSTGDNSAPKPKAWSNMDFRHEVIPMKEEQFWGYLGSFHLKRNESLSPPVIEGKQVNLYQLFQLVHRNGGTSRLYGNVSAWQYLAGVIGFALETDTPTPVQPPPTAEGAEGDPQHARSSIPVAMQIRQLYQRLVLPLEDMYYKKLYTDRLKAAAQGQQQQLPPSGGNGTPGSVPAMMSSTPESLMNAIAKAQSPSMRQNSTSSTSGMPQQGTPGSNSMTKPNWVDFSETLPVAEQIRMIKTSPHHAVYWVESKEVAMRKKFPKELRELPDDEKPRFIAELRALSAVAREAQQRAPTFVIVSMEVGMEEFLAVGGLVSMYMFIFIALQQAELGRFPFSLDDLSKLREPINRTLLRLNNMHKQLAATPEGQATLQRILPALQEIQARQSNHSNLMGPPLTPRIEDISSRIPQGLRVEDLKPPPAKRQRAASVRTAGASPSSPRVGTPDARTPGRGVDSPGASGPGVNRRASSSNIKRKRQSSVAITPGRIKGEMGQITASSPLATLPPMDLSGNALGIKLESAKDAEAAQHAAFIAAHDALRRRASEPTQPLSQSQSKGSADVWSSLVNALNEFSANTSTFSNLQNLNGQIPQLPQLPNGSTNNFGNGNTLSSIPQFPNPMSTAMNNSASNTGMNMNMGMGMGMGNMGDDDLFDQFIDFSSIDDDKYALATPELYRVASHDDAGAASDTSPESIRTVGSQVGKTPIPIPDSTSANQNTNMTDKGGNATGEKENTNGNGGKVVIMGGVNSPEAALYNGTIFSNWDEEVNNGLDNVATA